MKCYVSPEHSRGASTYGRSRTSHSLQARERRARPQVLLAGRYQRRSRGAFRCRRPHRTVDNWIAPIPEFAAEVKQGRDVADAAVVQSLHSRATGYSYETEKIFHYRGEVRKVLHTVRCPPDPTACMFWQRNRRPQHWLEKAEPREEEEFDFARALDAAGEAMRPVAGDARRAEEE